MAKPCPKFWQHHPALLYGLMAIWGVLLALSPTLWPYSLLFLAILTFSVSFANWIRFTLSLLLAGSVFLLTHQTYTIPRNLPDPIRGVGLLNLYSMTTSKSPFGEAKLYKGTLTSFESSDGVIARNLPITIAVPIEMTTPPIDHTYQIEGRLRRSDQGKFSLSPDKKIAWKPIKSLWSLAEIRYQTKQIVKQTIDKHITSPHTAAFLTGIARGEFDDMQLSFELGRFGLQHLMAISGLHFSILAAILGCLFGIAFNKKVVSAAVMISLTLYFIFLGHSPSVLRAWIAIALMMGAVFIERRSRALNSLGVALLVLALLDPLAIQSIPFQFSFGVTASILLWFAPCDQLLQKVFQKRPLSLVSDMHWLDQHGYCILHFLRQGLALALAVNLVALPLTLFYFQKFPVMSLLYNLFFPFLVSVSMLLLLLGLPLLWAIPPLGKALFWLNEHYTSFLLDFFFNLPKNFDKTWTASPMDSGFILSFMIILFAAGIWVRSTTNVEEAA